MKEIAEQWKKLNDKKKLKFQKQATKDKERYAKELSQHEQKMQESLPAEIKLKMQFSKLTCKELVDKCKNNGISSSGNKNILIQSLVDYESASETEDVIPDINKDLTQKSVKELKQMCKEKGLKTSGKKQDLINYLNSPENSKKTKSHPAPIITKFNKSNLQKLKVSDLRLICVNKKLDHDGLKKKQLVELLLDNENKQVNEEEGAEEEVEEDEVQEEEGEEEEVEEEEVEEEEGEEEDEEEVEEEEGEEEEGEEEEEEDEGEEEDWEDWEEEEGEEEGEEEDELEEINATVDALFEDD